MSAVGTTKPKKKKRNRILLIALLTLAVYVVITLTRLQMTLNERRQVSETLDAAISERVRENEALEEKKKNIDQNLEEQARDQGLARPGEIIFQEVPGT